MGVLHLPKGKKKFPLVIICYGFDGWKSKRIFVGLSRVLGENGIASFRFDFEGHGDSEGNFEDITVRREVEDLESAIEFVLKQKRINKNKIVFLGHSLGCAVILPFLVKNKIFVPTLIFGRRHLIREI